MTKLKLGLSITALVTAAAAGLALAQPEPNPGGPAQMAPPPLARPVTRDMARVGAERLFARLDVNNDGKLDAVDRDGRIAAMFDTIDSNHDGAVSRAEFIASLRNGPEGRGPEGLIQVRGLGMALRIMREADPQHTGTVTRDAFVAAALTLFDRSDLNHDGKVTPEERRAGMAGMSAPGGAMRRGMQGGDMMPPPAPEE